MTILDGFQIGDSPLKRSSETCKRLELWLKGLSCFSRHQHPMLLKQWFKAWVLRFQFSSLLMYGRKQWEMTQLLGSPPTIMGDKDGVSSSCFNLDQPGWGHAVSEAVEGWLICLYVGVYVCVCHSAFQIN